MAGQRSNFRRAGPVTKRSVSDGGALVAFLTDSSQYEQLFGTGYVRLCDHPDVTTAIYRIADMISSMTIYLMENSADGDIRIHDQLSRKIDIEPYQLMTRKSWMQTIVTNLLLHGDGNSVVFPTFRDGLIDNLIPIPASKVRFESDSDISYNVYINNVRFRYDDVLHFTLNPNREKPWLGVGYKVALNDVVKNLNVAQSTKQKFMASEWKPSVVVAVSGMSSKFDSKESRDELRKRFVSATPGEPAIVPAEIAEIKEIRPISMKDLAINDSLTIDKRQIASIIGCPPFFLGIGDFKREEFNNWIDSKLMPVARGIEQELTRKLLISPNRYFKFNIKSLYAYDLSKMAAVHMDFFVRGLMKGNEARGVLDLTPLPELNELTILENFIPVSKIGEQSKLDNNENIQKTVDGGDSDA